MNLPPFNLLLGQTATPLPPIAPGSGTFWLPPAASSAAVETDFVFYFIYWVAVFFFVLIVALMVYFVYRYRARTPGQAAESQVSHHTTLELTWTAIPLVLVAAMFYMGFRGFIDILNPPRGALDVRVLAKKWDWFFTYPNGHTDAELHVPVDTPVRLILESNDVIHSLFIPAFRIKRDAVPGRYNKIWFRARQPGDYLLLCSEFCGTQHSQMQTRVVVHRPGEYETWLAEASDPFRTRSLAEVGAMIVQRRCTQCHTIDGRAHTGPSLKGIYEHEVELDNGTKVMADDDYLRESILYPQAKIVKGFGREMSSFKGVLKDKEITAIIEYIKQLSQERTEAKP